jgi:hypothetical protein
MPGFEIGLQHRIKRLVQQTADQHRHLGALHREIEQAFDRGARDEARGAAERFEAALAAHFELEQQVFFPALHGLAPARANELEALEREHAGFSSELRRVVASIASTPVDVARAELARCLGALRSHEEREERVIAAIAGEA